MKFCSSAVNSKIRLPLFTYMYNSTNNAKKKSFAECIGTHLHIHFCCVIWMIESSLEKKLWACYSWIQEFSPIFLLLLSFNSSSRIIFFFVLPTKNEWANIVHAQRYTANNFYLFGNDYMIFIRDNRCEILK